MSISAPWFALSSDWSDSEMFDDSAMGVRLAWVELLAWTKAHGRAGRVRLRDKAFAKQRRLAEEAVIEMLDRASSGRNPAIIRQGDEITIANWKKYQDPKFRTSNDLASNSHSFTKTSENDATDHRPPSTNHQAPDTPTTRRKSGASNDSVLTESALSSHATLRRWFDHDLTRSDSIVQDSESFWVNVKASAAKAVKAKQQKKSRDPIALFKWLVKHRKWDHVPDECDDLAAQKERDLKRLTDGAT